MSGTTVPSSAAIILAKVQTAVSLLLYDEAVPIWSTVRYKPFSSKGVGKG